MRTLFVNQNIWPQLTKAVRRAPRRCTVAVAYFGAGASRLLPLAKGSQLVVDASERAVSCGQTCPSDVQKLTNNGVVVYSVPNLHAKVFVVGQAVYVGSTNVSSRSAAHLVEAVIRTTEPGVINDARKFIEGLCLHELTPAVLKRLAQLYRPPKIPGGGRRRSRETGTSERPALPRTYLAQVDFVDWTKDEQALHDRALPTARKRRQHRRGYQLDCFIDEGSSPHELHDVVIQVNNHPGGKSLVAPPGNVVHRQAQRHGKKLKIAVFIERPARRCRDVRRVAAKLGRGTQKKLRKDGVVKDRKFLQSLLNSWA